MLTVESELTRLFGAPVANTPASQDMGLSPFERRAAWIREQRLSQAEADEIPLDYDPAYPYPREA